MTKGKSNQRKQFWIDPSFQRRYLRMITAIALMTLVYGTVLPLVIGFTLDPPKTPFGWALLIIIGTMMVGAIWMIIAHLGIRASHKLCGPVYRIRAELEAIDRGEIPKRIVLREDDELQDLAEAFNKLIGMVAEQRTAGAVQMASSGPVSAEANDSDHEDIRLREAS